MDWFRRYKLIKNIYKYYFDIWTEPYNVATKVIPFSADSDHLQLYNKI